MIADEYISKMNIDACYYKHILRKDEHWFKKMYENWIGKFKLSNFQKW